MRAGVEAAWIRRLRICLEVCRMRMCPEGRSSMSNWERAEAYSWLGGDVQVRRLLTMGLEDGALEVWMGELALEGLEAELCLVGQSIVSVSACNKDPFSIHTRLIPLRPGMGNSFVGLVTTLINVYTARDGNQ